MSNSRASAEERRRILHASHSLGRGVFFCCLLKLRAEALVTRGSCSARRTTFRGLEVAPNCKAFRSTGRRQQIIAPSGRISDFRSFSAELDLRTRREEICSNLPGHPFFGVRTWGNSMHQANSPDQLACQALSLDPPPNPPPCCSPLVAPPPPQMLPPGGTQPALMYIQIPLLKSMCLFLPLVSRESITGHVFLFLPGGRNATKLEAC